MSTKRRIGGVSVATSESARRQLMQPVPCWEKMWVTPEDAPSGSTLKVYKWVKSDKKQHFSDDEEEVDEPLAPLPDEPEVIENEEEMDQDDPAASVVPDTASVSRAVSEPIVPPTESEGASAPPQPHPLSMSLVPPSPTPQPGIDGVLDADLQPPEPTIDLAASLDGADPSVLPDLTPDDLPTLDLSGLGPDGTQFESSDDLSQLQATDIILGGEVMDQSVDPFSAPP
ncbi:hypothetical protein BD410DRAFT_824913 [Rickenella mellea]|uniref:Uncharacterized protein n=1 Tax=Rickenella mellea TaxID=50990 RepID=A0A4Y7QLV0_9AGAM|nr:hypothetical protein BD410DRAFT_824913 [Rickenella mellea]